MKTLEPLSLNLRRDVCSRIRVSKNNFHIPNCFTLSLIFFILRREQRRLWGHLRMKFQNFEVTSVCIVCTRRSISGKIKFNLVMALLFYFLNSLMKYLLVGKFDFKQSTKSFSRFCGYGNRDCKKAPGCHIHFEVTKTIVVHTFFSTTSKFY